MRDALLRDLAELPDVEVFITCDIRLSPPQYAAHTISVNTQDDVWQVWETCVASADAVWPIAPETNGELLKLTQLIEHHHKTILGSTAEAVKLAGSKYGTYLALLAAGVSVVPTYQFENWPQSGSGSWVAKPDDGVGCEDSTYRDDADMLIEWLANGRQSSHVIQPLLAGTPASISMLCQNGEAWLLSCNRQKIQMQDGRFRYQGSVLNAMADRWEDFARVAKDIAAAIPGLAGYIGIDLIVQENQLVVLEVNPRLTTSYAGLSQSMNSNPAGLVLDLLYHHASTKTKFTMLQHISHNVVEVSFNDQA